MPLGQAGKQSTPRKWAATCASVLELQSLLYRPSSSLNYPYIAPLNVRVGQNWNLVTKVWSIYCPVLSVWWSYRRKSVCINNENFQKLSWHIGWNLIANKFKLCAEASKIQQEPFWKTYNFSTVSNHMFGKFISNQTWISASLKFWMLLFNLSCYHENDQLSNRVEL